MITCDLIHPTDTVKPGNREHHERTWSRLDTVCHRKIRLLGTMPIPLCIDDEFSTPIRSPLVMKVADQGNTSARCSRTFKLIALIGIVMGQQAISCRVRIIVETYVSARDIWKGLYVGLYTG